MDNGRVEIVTGLLDRKEFKQRVTEKIIAARRKNLEQVLGYIDTDQFQLHELQTTDDDLLRRFGEFIRTKIPHNCAIARIDNNGFSVLFENHSLTEARHIAEKLLQAAHRHRFECSEINSDMCIGLVAIPPDGDQCIDALAAAQTACRDAREGGQRRLQVHRLDDMYLPDRVRGMRWLSEIPKAIQSQRFSLLRQDILPTGTQLVPGAHFEVMTRMLDDDNQRIPPHLFIPPAEHFGLMSEIDRIVIKKVFEFFSNHTPLRHITHTIAINLSSASCRHEGFLDFLRGQICAHNVPPAVLCFELSETDALTNLDRSVAFMLELKQLGCRVALDNFGGGIWPFTHLKHLPIDYLKIDGSFVRSISDSSADLAAAQAIHRVGRAMGVSTIATSVETADCLDKLAAIGVDYVQGWAVAKLQRLEALSNIER